MRAAILLYLMGTAYVLAAASEALDGPERTAAERAPESAQGWERYRVVVQRNIFSKERGRRDERSSRREREREAPPPPPPPRVENEWVLIGTRNVDGLPAAIIENRSSGKIQTVQPGDAVGRGKVTAVTLDTLEFENDVGARTVKFGTTLGGGEPPSAAPAPASTGTAGVGASPAGTAPATGAAGTTGSNGSTGSAPPPAAGSSTSGGSSTESVLERLRRKRQEELKK